MKSSSILFVLAAVSASAVLVVSSASCGSSRADCNPASCSGCCDANHECQPGFLNDACGVNGAACAVCASPTACGNGVCLGGSTGGNKDAGTCKALGASCALNTECCSNACDGTACVPNGTTDGGTSDGGMPGCSNITGDRQTQVCLRWKCDRADLAEGSWTGDVASCNAGDAVENRAKAVKLVNLYRFLAELPPVTDEATRNQQAQQCALMMNANNTLSHTPPSTWTCYSADGAAAAGKSNISTTPGVSAIDLYMVDPGNDTTLGHRRWILSQSLGPIGSGSTSQYSCLYVIGGSGTKTRSYVAWPPAGPVPVAALTPSGAFGNSVNTTGWSIQSSDIDLNAAVVAVTDLTSGSSMPITVTKLGQNYGDTYALRFNPTGWTAQAGHSYRVAVTGVLTPFNYQVDVVSCP